MDKSTHILIVEDVDADAELIEREIARKISGGKYLRVETREAFLNALMTFGPQVVVSDYRLPSFDGLAALKLTQEHSPGTPVIIVTGSQNEDTAVECMKSGAVDYIIKEHVKRLGPAVANALETRLVRIEKQKAEHALRESEERYRTITENMTDTVWVMDMNFKTTYISPSVIKTRGYTLDELKDMPLEGHITPESLAAASGVIAEEMTPERLAQKNLPISRVLELEFYRKDGSTFWGDIVMTLVRDEAGNPKEIIGVGRDITERKQTGMRIHHLNQVLKSVRNVNQLITQQKDAKKLLDGACRILNEVRGYEIVWIGMLDRDGGNMTPEAWAGISERSLKKIAGRCRDISVCTEPACSAIRERKAHLFTDIQEIPEYRDWSKVLKEHGLKSSVSVPILGGDRVFGVLNVYSSGADAFFGEETGLLEEVAADIAYALANIETEKKRDKAERALIESERRVRIKLDSVLSPEGDIGALELADIVDGPAVQSLMEDFYRLTHIGVAVSDISAKVLVATGWQDICTKFHRIHPETCKYCVESDIQLSKGVKSGTYNLYRCKNNMWDMATPIVVGGRHVGNLYLGQFFFSDESIDHEVFRAQAKKYGFDEKQYMDALDRVPRWSRETVDAVMTFYTKLSKMISDLSYGNIKLARTLAERDNLLKSLSESEERYRALFENATVGIFHTLPEGRFIIINHMLAAMMGYGSPEEAIASVTDFEKDVYVDPGRRAEMVSSVLASSGWVGHEARYRRRDGEVRIAEMTVRAVRDRDGAVEYLEGFVRDITESRAAEEALKSQAAFMQTLIDAIPNPVFYMDTGGRYLGCNVSFERDMGRTKDEMIGATVYDLNPREFADLYDAKNRELFENPGTQIYDAHIVESDGTARDVIFNKATFLDKDGVVGGLVGVITDITERKRMEQAIRESEEQYRSLVENLNDAIFNLDQNGVFTYMSPIIEKISHFTPDQVEGRPFTDFIHPDDLARSVESFQRTISGVLEPTEFRIIDKNGDPVEVSTSSRPLYRGGEIVGLTGMLTDISRKKEAERRLHETLVELQHSYEETGALLVGARAILMHRKFADSAREIFKSCKNLIGADSGYVATLTHNDGEDEIVYLDQGAKRYTVETYLHISMHGLREAAYRTKKAVIENDFADGKRAGSPPKDGPAIGNVMFYPIVIDRKAAGIIVLADKPRGFSDDDARRAEAFADFAAVALINSRAIESLEASELKYRTVFESSKDMVYVSNIDGRFIDINAAGEELLGYTRDELMSLHMKTFYADPADREAFVATITQQGFVKDYEATLKRKDGSHLDCLITAAIRRDAGNVIVGSQGVIRDMTERKRMQQQLIQTEKLSSLGGILSGVAHELNNPLTSIIGNAQLLMRKNISDEIRAKLDVIFKESQRSTKIVQGLLAFARKHKPERRRADINEVVREAYQLREYELRVNNVAMQLTPSPTPLMTSVDPHQLLQVFINIINNAHDALVGVGGGALLITTTKKEDEIVIEFRDDGPGIPEDIRKFIFDPFFTTKDVGKGTGLGLSIAYGIVSEHGGRIDLETGPGKGSTFIITLPVVHEQVKEKKPTTIPTVRPEGKKSILVVEDEDNLRELLVEALENEGYLVFDTANGEAAIEVIGSQTIDMVLSDIKMPGIGGRELYTYVQKNHPDLSGRILFITGDVLSKDTQIFLRITGNKYVEKPFNIEKLLDLIGAMLAGNEPNNKTKGQ